MIRKKHKEDIIHFYSPSLQVEQTSQVVTPDKLVKRGLVLVSGDHIDSKKRAHSFSVERIQEIADNTNKWIRSGGDIPLLKDHKKELDSTIGHLESELTVKEITEDDLPDPRLKDLIGKVGLFAESLVAKGKDVVTGFLAGRIKTLSPGIDVVTNTIREISFTPTPAIRGLMTFKRGDNLADFALTMADAENETQDINAYREEFDNVCDAFWNVVTNIQEAGEDELGGADPTEYLNQAINDFSERLADLLGLNEPPPNQGMPGMQMQQPMRQYETSNVLAAFTLGDMEKLNQAEFSGLAAVANRAAGNAGGFVGRAYGWGARKAKSVYRATKNFAGNNTNKVKNKWKSFQPNTKRNIKIGGGIVGGGVALGGGYAGYNALTNKRRKTTITTNSNY